MKLAPQHRIYLCFFIFAISIGALLSRMPDLQTKLGVSKSELGLTLMGQAIGALISLTFGPPLINRLGTGAKAFITVLETSAFVALVPWVAAAPFVFCVLLAEGLLARALEINLNVEGDRIEAQLGKAILNRAHGFWSLGFFITALISSAVRQAGISIELHLLIVFAFALILGIPVIGGIKNALARPFVDDTHVPLIALPTIGLIPLCVIGIAAFLAEGAGMDWSAVYMRDVFAVEPFVDGLGLTLFAMFMTILRLSADPFVDRYGACPIATILLTTSAIGAFCVWIAPHPYVTLCGFARMGAGSGAVYPLAVSAAAQRTNRPAHLNVASVTKCRSSSSLSAHPLLALFSACRHCERLSRMRANYRHGTRFDQVPDVWSPASNN